MRQDANVAIKSLIEYGQKIRIFFGVGCGRASGQSVGLHLRQRPDACLAQDPQSRVACETLVKSNQVVLAGEITTKAKLNYGEIVRQAIREIGYVNEDDVFHADKVFITNNLTSQSPDIAQGVDARRAKDKYTAEQGAGDQGIMFGYASNETKELMPAVVMYAHHIGREIAKIRHGRQAKWLRPDCKSQVSIRYEGNKAVEITAVVISTQHTEDVRRKDIEKFMIEKVIKRCLPKRLLTKNTEFLINPTGRFVIGGPQGDAGLTGRKIIVDTYGGAGHHGGGAFRARTCPRWTARRPTCVGGWPRTLWLQALLIEQNCKSPTRLDTLSLYPSL